MKWLNIAKSYLGLAEIVGAEDNPKIVKMYADVGFPNVKSDETAWCAAFVGSCLKQDNKPYLKSLAARSYLNYGIKSDPKEGAIAVFWRGSPSGWQGHVGFITKWDNTHVWVIGGNQGNKVSEQAFPRTQLLGIRYPNVVATTEKITQTVVQNSNKLSFLQGIRRIFTALGATIASLFTMDFFNTATTITSTIKTTIGDNLFPIILGSIALGWLVLKVIEYMSVKDYQEGRYIPSGMHETAEVNDGLS